MAYATLASRLNPFSWLYDWSIGNPIIVRELIRSLRKGRYFILMALILVVGTGILGTLWTTPDDGTRPVGRFLFYSTVGGQLLVIILLLPGYVAQSLIMERDRGTFPLLLTTPLSPFRIVYGKLVSTLGVMVVLIISTYPLIGVCMARGGVSPMEVVVCVIGLLFASFDVAAFAIYHALHASTPLRAIMLTQFTFLLAHMIGGAIVVFVIGMVMAILFMVTSIAGIPQQDVQVIAQNISVLLALPLLSIIPITLLYLAAKRLRFTEPRIRQSWEMEESTGSFQLGQSVESVHHEPHNEHGIPDAVNPFYWRERKGQLANLTPMSVPSWYIIAIVAYHLLLITPIEEGRWLAIVTLVFLAQMVPAHAATLFAGERENESWDLLITTMFKAPRMLMGKIQGALYPCLQRWAMLFFTPLAIIYGLYLFFFLVTQRNVIPVAPAIPLLFYILVMLANILFLTMLATWLSIRFDQVNKVLVWSYGIAAGYYFLPLVLQQLGLRFEILVVEQFFRMLSPLSVVYDIASDPMEFVLHGVIHWTVLVIAAAVFYRLSLRSIEQTR